MTSLQETFHAPVELAALPAPPPPELAVADSTAGLIKLPLRDAARAFKRRRFPRGIERFAGVVLLFAGWQVASSAGWLSPTVLAGPSTVVKVGWDMIKDGTLGDALWTSLQRVLWGLGIGIVVGAVLALFAGLSRVGDDLVDSNVQMLATSRPRSRASTGTPT